MAPNPKLDQIDLKILVELQKNGLLLNIQLAELVGLSPSPCLQRVKRLEAAGYIMGYGPGSASRSWSRTSRSSPRSR